MSKVDAQRAMREAKYLRNRANAAAGKPPAAEVKPAASASASTSTKPAPKAPRTPPAASATGELCGHKSMNGRACTRPAGHAEKNHRYS